MVELMKGNAVWNFWADRYEKLWVQKYSLRPTRALIIEQLRKVVNDNSLDLLDIGCGTGQLAREIRENYSSEEIYVTGLDFSEKMIANAVKKEIANCEFIVGDAQALSFANEQFAIITCCHSFPYYPNQLQALREFLRVLKPGGYIFLIQAAEDNFYDSLIMKFVKLTTGKASYPSAHILRNMISSIGGQVVAQQKLKTSIFMPSIIISIVKK